MKNKFSIIHITLIMIFFIIVTTIVLFLNSSKKTSENLYIKGESGNLYIKGGKVNIINIKPIEEKDILLEGNISNYSLKIIKVTPDQIVLEAKTLSIKQGSDRSDPKCGGRYGEFTITRGETVDLIYCVYDASDDWSVTYIK